MSVTPKYLIRHPDLQVSIALHRGFKTLCWVPVRDLAITMHFFGVNGFLWMKLTY